jgi:hypothetical protein
MRGMSSAEPPPPNTVARIRGALESRDGGLLVLRRAGRTAIVMPALFAVGVKVIGNPQVAAFAAFGSFASLLLASFSGSMADRLRSQLAFALAGAVFVVLGTAVSSVDWLAALVTAVVAFGVLFAGVVSSVLAGATTALLLAFILPVSLPGAFSTVPDRLAGWGMASGAALFAVALLWPSPSRDTLRAPAIAACRALAGQLRTHVAHLLGDPPVPREELESARARAQGAVGALHRVFFATPYRPTGLSTATRALVRLVDELGWLGSVVLVATAGRREARVEGPVCTVKLAAATALERGADALESPRGECGPLRDALDSLRDTLLEMERLALAAPPVLEGGVSALDPTFRAQELSFVVAQIGANIEAVAAAERRSWLERLLGRRQPAGLPGPLSSAQERAASHFERHSVWLHNSLRGGAGLGLAVLIASLTGAQHSFWVVLGALSVLRSNALSTGQNAVRGLLGTVAGFIAGAALLAVIGSNTTILWLALAPAVLFAGFAPAAVSFAAGQGAFTLTLVILYNILQPAGWRVGLVRVEDIALGCAVSVLVGILLWPRGAGAALVRALAQAYEDGADYLTAAVAFGMGRCDAGFPRHDVPDAQAARAAASARRLDDAFRTFLAERGAKRQPLADVIGLVTGVAGLRLAAEAVLELWRRDDGTGAAARSAARTELVESSNAVAGWYERLADGLLSARAVPDPLPDDDAGDRRLLDALRADLSGAAPAAVAAAVRMIWTADHLDAARRLQATLVEPARAAIAPAAPAPPARRLTLRRALSA